MQGDPLSTRVMTQDQQNTSRFTVLWLKAQPVLTGYVVSLVRDRAASDDIIQAVALTALEKMDAYDGQRSFEAWVIGIARFKVLQYFKAHKQDRLVFDEALIDQICDQYIETTADYDARLTALRDCMEKLPDETRELLNQRYFDKTSVKGIAQLLGRTPQRVSKQLHTIRRALQRCIHQRMAADGGAS